MEELSNPTRRNKGPLPANAFIQDHISEFPSPRATTATRAGMDIARGRGRGGGRGRGRGRANSSSLANNAGGSDIASSVDVENVIERTGASVRGTGTGRARVRGIGRARVRGGATAATATHVEGSSATASSVQQGGGTSVAHAAPRARRARTTKRPVPGGDHWNGYEHSRLYQLLYGNK